MRILVVDDQKVCFERIKQALVISGINSENIAHAKDGSEVERKVKSLDPSIIFLDIVMGKIDGFAALRKLKHQGYEKPIVMYSTKSQKSDIEHALKLGATDYLVKPVTLESMKECLSNLELL